MSDIVIGDETPVFVGHGFGPSAEDVYAFVRKKMATDGYLLDGARGSNVLAGSVVCDLQEDLALESGTESLAEDPNESLYRVYESLRPSREAREEAQAIVRREAEVRRHTDLSCFTDDAIRVALNYIEWQLFDDFDTPPPQGTILHDYGASLILVSKGSTVQASGAAAALYKATLARGANPRITELYDEQVSTYEATQAASQYIQQHPFYQTLASFANTKQHTYTEQPLTQYEKDVAAAAITATVRQKYGIQPGESYTEEPGVIREINRRVGALDDATVLKQSADVLAEDPFKKAQAYIESLFPDSLGVAEMLRKNVGDDRGSTVIELLQRSAGSYYEHVSPRRKLLTGMLEEYTKTVLHTIYQPAAGDVESSRKDYARLVSSDSVRNWLGQYFSRAYYGETSRLTKVGGCVNYQTHAQVRLGMLPHIYETYLHDIPPAYAMSISHPEDNMSMICSIEKAGDEPYAVVAEARMPAEAPQGMRMLTASAVLPYELPKPNAGTPHDLVIEWGSKMPLTPFTVAGFEPVAKDGSSLYFAYTPENDPYAPVDVPLPLDKFQSLLNEYENAGLGSLAQKLKATKPSTVEELRRDLAKYSSYISDGAVSKDVFANTIADLAKVYAVNGQMYYQCTGAAQLLKMSLQQLFGTESARPISGQVFDPTSRYIGPAGHAQVLFTHGGSQYYVDATPAQIDSGRANVNILRPLIRSLGDFVMRQFASQQPAVERLVVPSPPKVPSFATRAEAAPIAPTKPVFSKEHADAEIITLRDKRLLPVLHGYHGVPHADDNREKLYNEIMRLPEGDPSRRVLEMTHRLLAGNMVAADVAALRQYIQNVLSSGSDAPVFQFIDYQAPAQLKALEGIVGEAEAILAKVNV